MEPNQKTENTSPMEGRKLRQLAATKTAAMTIMGKPIIIANPSMGTPDQTAQKLKGKSTVASASANK